MKCRPFVVAAMISALAGCASKPPPTAIDVSSDRYAIELRPGDMISVTLVEEGTSSFCFGSLEADGIHAAGGPRVVRLDAIQKLTKIPGGCPAERLRNNGPKTAREVIGTVAIAASAVTRISGPSRFWAYRSAFRGRVFVSSPNVTATEVQKGLWSSGGVLRIGETTMHQPVFREDLTFNRVRAAVIEVLDKDVNDRYYVITFPLNIELRKDEWTAWQLPSFRTRNDPRMHLLHNRDHIDGEDLERMESEDSPPRMRYLLEDRKYGSNWITERRLNGEAHDIPPCP